MCLDNVSNQFPDKPAVVVAGSGIGLTYRELDEGSARLARYLYERGLRRGDHIALLTDNHPTAFAVYWAALRSGLYITAVNRHLAPDEVSYIVNDCGARAPVVSGSLGEVAATIVDATPDVRIRLAYHGCVEGYLSSPPAGKSSPGPSARTRSARHCARRPLPCWTSRSSRSSDRNGGSRFADS
jgi:fatty-acyl-CoA synthase